MTEKITFAPPDDFNTSVLAGIAGDTGTGKTLSAMRLMRGLLGSDDFHVIDTENGRAARYHRNFPGCTDPALAFDFKQYVLRPPFSAERYLQACKAAEADGAKGLILDSGSHLWEGDGGAQDQHDIICRQLMDQWNVKDRQKVTWKAWADVKTPINKLIQFLQATRMHVIVCLRAKPRVDMEKTVKGRKTYEKTPPQPITEPGMGYQFELLFVLEQGVERTAVPTFTYKRLPLYFLDLMEPYRGDLGSKGLMIDESLGRKIAETLAGEATGSEPRNAPRNAPRNSRENNNSRGLEYTEASGTKVRLQSWSALSQKIAEDWQKEADGPAAAEIIYDLNRELIDQAIDKVSTRADLKATFTSLKDTAQKAVSARQTDFPGDKLL